MPLSRRTLAIMATFKAFKAEPNVTAYSGDRRLDIALVTLDRQMMTAAGEFGAAVEVPTTGQGPA